MEGAIPEDAFEVQVESEEITTNENKTYQLLRIKIEVAFNRPMDFMEISIRQQIQKENDDAYESIIPAVSSDLVVIKYTESL